MLLVALFEVAVKTDTRVVWYGVMRYPLWPCTGVVSRTFGIMPEKAFKMQGWIIVGRYMESHFEQPTISKWLVAGAAAGAATTIIGECFLQEEYFIACYIIQVQMYMYICNTMSGG